MSHYTIIRAALAELPSQCRYHGAEIEDPERKWGVMPGACCDTGAAALRRRHAEAALKALEQPR